MSSQTYTDGVTLTAAAEFNNFDSVAYSVLSAVAGTNTITATGPATYSYAATRPPIWFIPAATNTGATTMNVTPSGGVALGAKNVFWNGAACVGGELKINVPAALIYDGTQLNIVAHGLTFNSRITATLGADVDLNNTSNYFDGPSVAQGTAGTWLATGSVSVHDTAGGAQIQAKLWDGTTVIASASVNTSAANDRRAITLSGYLASPAGNIRISCKDVTSTSGKILFNASGESKDATVSAIRIA